MAKDKGAGTEATDNGFRRLPQREDEDSSAASGQNGEKSFLHVHTDHTGAKLGNSLRMVTQHRTTLGLGPPRLGLTPSTTRLGTGTLCQRLCDQLGLLISRRHVVQWPGGIVASESCTEQIRPSRQGLPRMLTSQTRQSRREGGHVGRLRRLRPACLGGGSESGTFAPTRREDETRTCIDRCIYPP